MAKASTPRPIGHTTQGLWKHKGWELPPYVQHVASHLIEEYGESGAVERAVGIVQNWARGTDGNGGKVEESTQAAAQKAMAEWAKLKAKNDALKAKGSKAQEGRRLPTRGAPTLADRTALRGPAKARLRAIEEAWGIQAMLALMEAVGKKGWSPELKRTASASNEDGRFEVHDAGQMVGTVASRKAYDKGKPSTWTAMAVNGKSCSSYGASQGEALDGLKKHLEEGPARVMPHTDGKFLVSTPTSYGGQTTYAEFPSRSSARYAAGLPEERSTPEVNSEVEALGEMVSFDVLILESLGEELPAGLGALSEAASFHSFDEDLHPRDFQGRFTRKLSGLKVGGKAKAPGGVTVTRKPVGFTVEGGGNPSTPSALRAGNSVSSQFAGSAKVAATIATARSLRSKEPGSLGGKTRFESVSDFERANGPSLGSMSASRREGLKRMDSTKSEHVERAIGKEGSTLNLAHGTKVKVMTNGNHVVKTASGHEANVGPGDSGRRRAADVAAASERRAVKHAARPKAQEGVAPESVLGSLLLAEAELTTKERKGLSKDDFVYPDKAPGPGSYPIENIEHARDALGRAADPANSGDLADVQAKVYARYPELKNEKAKGGK